MANRNVPADLKDEVALRNYLQNLDGKGSVRNISYYEAKLDPSLLTGHTGDVLNQVLEVDRLAKKYYDEFNTQMWATVNEVKSTLLTLIPDEDTIVKTIDTELRNAEGALTALVGSVAYTAIDVSGNWAVSSDMDTVKTVLGESYSSVTTLASTYTTQDATGAIYEVAVDANGYVAGFRLVSLSGTPNDSSVFQIYANKFAICDSGDPLTHTYTPFLVDVTNGRIILTGDVYFQGLGINGDSTEISGGKLTNHSVTTLQLDALDITTNLLSVTDVAVFGNAFNTYTDDTAVNYILDGVTPLNPLTVKIGAKTISQYVADEIDAEVVVYSGTSVATAPTGKNNDLFIENKEVTDSKGNKYTETTIFKWVTSAWVEQTNADTSIADLADLADGKRTIYSGTATPEAQGYTPELRDIWIPEVGVVGYDAEEIYQYNGPVSGWQKATKYTDDSSFTTWQATVGTLAYLDTITNGQISDNTIEFAKLGGTVVSGGYIQTGILDAAGIKADIINVTYLNSVGIQAASIESTGYDWNAGSPVGFGAWDNGDPDSGQSYNIIGGKIYGSNITGTTISGNTITGGTISGTTINASTINIRDLNIINDDSKTVLPFFSTVGQCTPNSTSSPTTWTYDFDMYTYNSTATTEKRYVGTSGTTITLAKPEYGYANIYAGYLTICEKTSAFSTVAVYIKVGTTTLASKTAAWTVNTDYNIGGFTFNVKYDGASDYTICLKETAYPSVASTSTSPISIIVTVDFANNYQTDFPAITAMVMNL